MLWEHAGQVALGVVLALAVGPFWWSHRTEPSLLVAGLLVHVYAVLMIVLGARVIVSIRMLDLDAPVVEIQRALARLRRSYVMTGFVVGVPWWLLWIPLAMVVFGFDLGRVSRAWLVANVIVGVVGSPARSGTTDQRTTLSRRDRTLRKGVIAPTASAPLPWRPMPFVGVGR